MEDYIYLYRMSNKRMEKHKIPVSWDLRRVSEEPWGTLWRGKKDWDYGPSPSFYGYKKMKEAVVEEFHNTKERILKEQEWLAGLEKRMERINKFGKRRKEDVQDRLDR